MIGIIDYGAGNLGSVMNALSRLHIAARFVRGPEEIAAGGDGAASPFEKLIFPGDGHFASAMAALSEKGYDAAIKTWIAADRPFLGICIGLQLLFESSEEAPPGDDGARGGLAVLPGKVRLFPGRKVPQIGWNKTRPRASSRLFSGDTAEAYYYYIHSYYAAPEKDSDIAAEADYYLAFCAAIERGALAAVQFHPEKSGASGLSLLETWCAR